MGFWLRFWYGNQDGDADIRVIRDSLDRVEELEPEWRTSPHADGRDVTWEVRFVQNTPDGDLTTTVTLSSGTARIEVGLGAVGYLSDLRYFKDYGQPGCDYGKINKFAVQYVREWLDRRVLPKYMAAYAQKERERESELKEHEAKIAAMRKKYLP